MIRLQQTLEVVRPSMSMGHDAVRFNGQTRIHILLALTHAAVDLLWVVCSTLYFVIDDETPRAKPVPLMIELSGENMINLVPGTWYSMPDLSRLAGEPYLPFFDTLQ